MSNPISSPPPGGPPPDGAPAKPKDDVSQFLDSVKINPGDEKLLKSPFGKMILKYSHNEDEKTKIKLVKKAIEQCFNFMTQDLKRAMKRSEEAMKKLGKESRGERSD